MNTKVPEGQQLASALSEFERLIEQAITVSSYLAGKRGSETKPGTKRSCVWVTKLFLPIFISILFFLWKIPKMLASAYPVTFGFKLPRLFHPMPLSTTRPVRRRPMMLSYLTHHHRNKLNSKSLSNRAVFTRVSGDGGGQVDATPPQSIPPVSSELLCFVIWVCPFQISG